MQRGDLATLGERAYLYEASTNIDELSTGLDSWITGGLGEVVTILQTSSSHTLVRVLHPVHGIRDIFAHNLRPMAGEEAR